MEVVKVPADQCRRQVRVARLELRDGLRRDVEPDQVQSRIGESYVVPPIVDITQVIISSIIPIARNDMAS